jgi:hypothetical protein
MNIVNSFLSITCKFILLVMGWKLNYNIKSKLSSISKKAVLIYPHSHYLDYVIFCLYYYAYEMENFYTIVTERFIPFESMCSFLIPAPDFAVRNYMEKGFSRLRSIYYAWIDRITGKETRVSNYKPINFVSQVCDKVRNKESYYILISPTGSVTKDEWKTGYYYIAKELGVPIIVVGVDYDKKSGIVSKSFDINNYSLEDQNILKDSFNKIKTFKNDKELYIINWASVIHFFNCVLFFTSISNLLGLLVNILYSIGVYEYLVTCQNFMEFYMCKLIYTLYILIKSVESDNSFYLGLLGLLVYFNASGLLYRTSYSKNKLVYVLSELLYGTSCYYISYFGK